ncbi:MAG: DNA-binding protein WhiA [Clostridiales bacterium]|jgi:DNA-binding protein WhiA|nr:DNA-binding protein WhiA [Clostridiales bacterium]
MSFSSDVRKELCAAVNPNRHCQLAELSAIINASCEISPSNMTLHTENELVARRFQRLLIEIFQIAAPESLQKNTRAVSITNGAQALKILKATGCILENGSAKKDVSPAVVMDNCCKRAYVRGSFIACGTISDPFKTYHLEFSLPPPDNERLAAKLSGVLKVFGLKPKTLTRKSHALVYIKESDNIADALIIMEAPKSLLKLENVRIEKDLRNSVNRQVNFETANLNKTVGAAVGQIEDIRYIERRVGLGQLSENLEEVARLRLKYEAASLKEIGSMLSNPVGKSGVNHRLRKISEIAENLRREEMI